VEAVVHDRLSRGPWPVGHRLIAMGLQRVSVRLDACAACPIGQAQTSIMTTLRDARQLLAVYGLADRVVELSTVTVRKNRPVYTAKNPPLSRRGLFRMFAAEGPRQIARVLTDKRINQIKSPSPERRPIMLRHCLLLMIHPRWTVYLSRASPSAINAQPAACARICQQGRSN
jgi:hypothetical protein